MEKQNLLREAAEDAMSKHVVIIQELKDIITLNYQNFRVVNNETEEELTGLKTIDFINDNIQYKIDIIKAYSSDIQTCYDQMGIFDKE